MLWIRGTPFKVIVTLHTETLFLRRPVTHSRPLRAIASDAVTPAENDENVDNDDNGIPSHRKSTMTYCYPLQDRFYLP